MSKAEMGEIERDLREIFRICEAQLALITFHDDRHSLRSIESALKQLKSMIKILAADVRIYKCERAMWQERRD